MKMKKKAYLTLEDGRVFEGISFGAERETIGELVFTTGMTGYLETLTDPSYYGQIVTQTFPLIGNYGVTPDKEGDRSHVFGYVVRERCEAPSNFRSEGTIEDFLKKSNIPAIYGVDTRELTKIVREHGVMNAAISFRPFTDFDALKRYRVSGALQAVTCKNVHILNEGGEYFVVLYDYGAKENIVRELVRRGCKVAVVPAEYPAEQALALHPDGIMLTNGPGDPADDEAEIKIIRELAGKKPIFGICLGHQLFALAMGGKTRKMKYGHRGANQPVKELASGKVFVTSQNHGYEVLSETVSCGRETFVNANDGTCEGMSYPDLDAETVQFHPEACGGPHDANYLFDGFLSRMKKEKQNAQEK